MRKAFITIFLIVVIHPCVAQYLTFDGKKHNGGTEQVILSQQFGWWNSYSGSFRNDKLNQGKLILKTDGLYFNGSFKDTQPYNGKWYYMDGSLYSTVTNGV